MINVDNGCGIIPADWGGPVPLLSGYQSVGNYAGNVKLTCQFDIPDGLAPDKAQHFSGFPCSTDFGLTTNSRSVVSPGGKVTLQCQIKANAIP